MKYLKRFNESISDPWDEITSSLDVGQLLDLIHFKYGKDSVPESSKEFDDYEGDYNPDDIYDSIRFELEESGKLDDFLQNYQAYSIEKDENDPFHWRHRKKQQDEFNKSFNNLSEAVSENFIRDILLDLTDEGFKYKISWSGNPIPGKMNKKGSLVSFAPYPFLKIEVSRPTNGYLYSDIKDSIDRLSSYLETEGYSRLGITMNSTGGRIYTAGRKDLDHDDVRMFSTSIDYKFSTLGLLKAKSKFAI